MPGHRKTSQSGCEAPKRRSRAYFNWHREDYIDGFHRWEHMKASCRCGEWVFVENEAGWIFERATQN